MDRVQKVIKILPGLAISIVCMIVSILIAKVVPLLGGATIAIFLGIFLGNTIIKNKIFNAGTKFASILLLQIAIVTLGGTLTIDAIMQIGIEGVIFLTLQLLLTIAVCIFIGKKFKFSKNTTLLLAAGNGVCGSNAVAATAPVIGASENERNNAIVLVNVMGTILMVLLPVIAVFLYGGDIVKSSALIGGVVQGIGHVVASGYMVGDEVGQLAVIFKMVKVISLVFVVVGMGIISKDSENKMNLKVSSLAPWYLIGFFIFCLFASFNFFPPQSELLLEKITSYLQTIALAATNSASS